MQKNIHPIWNHSAIVKCACGTTFTTGSISENIEVDICSKCHPFYTGEERFVDTQGRVEKFIKKMQAAKARKAKIAEALVVEATKAKKPAGEPKTYQQLLAEQKITLKQEEKQETV